MTYKQLKDALSALVAPELPLDFDLCYFGHLFAVYSLLTCEYKVLFGISCTVLTSACFLNFLLSLFIVVQMSLAHPPVLRAFGLPSYHGPQRLRHLSQPRPRTRFLLRATPRHYAAAGIGGIRQGTSNPIKTLPADVREYPDAIAQSLSQLRLVGVNGPYSVLLGADAYTALAETSDYGYPVLERQAVGQRSNHLGARHRRRFRANHSWW